MKNIDVFHLHEALHTAYNLCEYIDVSLVQHRVYEEAPEEIKNLLNQAQDKLNQYYQWCARQQDLMMEERDDWDVGSNF